MDPVTLVVVPGFLGGLVIALFFIRLQRGRQTRASADAFSGEPLSTDVINMARIRVAGVGGLGLVAMALVVALFVPRVGQSLTLGLVLGAMFAAILILRRRRHGPVPSSGRRAGANTTLSIDLPPRSAAEQNHDSSNVRTEDVAAVPAPSLALRDAGGRVGVLPGAEEAFTRHKLE